MRSGGSIRRRSAQLPPFAPSAVRRRLPNLPDVSVTPPRKHFLPSILVDTRCELLGQEDVSSRRVQGRPPAPAIVWGHLPSLPERAVAPHGEDLLATVGIPTHDVCRDRDPGCDPLLARPSIVPAAPGKLPDTEHPPQPDREHLKPTVLIALHDGPAKLSLSRSALRKPQLPHRIVIAPLLRQVEFPLFGDLDILWDSSSRMRLGISVDRAHDKGLEPPQVILSSSSSQVIFVAFKSYAIRLVRRARSSTASWSWSNRRRSGASGLGSVRAGSDQAGVDVGEEDRDPLAAAGEALLRSAGTGAARGRRKRPTTAGRVRSRA